MGDLYARRRRKALAAVAGGAALIGLIIGATSGGDSTPNPQPRTQLPGGGTTIFPGRTVVALYGLPGAPNLGRLGSGSATSASRKLAQQAKPYDSPERPVLPAMEMISTLARDTPQASGNYTSRTPHSTIRRYLQAVRRVKGILILNIQPGRGKFGPEIDYLARWLKEPDVGLALDPQWKVGANEIPGQVNGDMTAAEVNGVSAYLSRLVAELELPQKLLLVHQFNSTTIRNPARLRRYSGVGLAISIAGTGTPQQKTTKYEQLAKLTPDLTHGIKLYYNEDAAAGALMTPKQVLALQPEPGVVTYK